MVLLLLAFAAPSLDRYNVTWDEALGDFFFGQRYFSYATTLDEVYLDFEVDPYPPDHRPDLRHSPFRGRPWEYYPVANTLAAATSVVFSQTLGWLDPLDGFHALNLILVVLLIATFFPFLARHFGLAAASMGILFLITSPRVFSHMMANIKDFPLMVFFSLTCLAFLRALEKGSLVGLLGAGILWGLTLGTKANGVFLPLIPAGLLLLGGIPEAWRGREKTLFLGATASGSIGGLVLVGLWPYLWANPWGRLLEHFNYLSGRKDVMNAESFAPVLEAIALTTPPVFLGFFAVGLVRCTLLAVRRHRPSLLLLLWIGSVLGRYLLPQAVNFDGVRHFLELFPPMAGVAGAGAAWSVKLVVENLGRRLAMPESRAILLRAAVLVLLAIPGARAVLVTHPFQIVYWNTFAGGYRGAVEQGLPQASDYWGMSYRLGLEWLNDHAPPDALLAVPVVEHAVRLVAPERLRSDITLLPVTTPFSPRIAPERLQWTREAALESPLYVMFVPRRDWMNELMLDCLLYLEPEQVWTLEETPVLLIYRYGPGGQSPD